VHRLDVSLADSSPSHPPMVNFDAVETAAGRAAAGR
jgi:hypothetical protein